jgi:hypothetical protein
MSARRDDRDDVLAFWSFERPRRIPLTVYRMFTRLGDPAGWRELFARGIVPVDSFSPVRWEWTGDVDRVVTEYDRDGLHWRRTAIRTPVGEVFSLHADGWQQKYMLRTAEDYRVMTYAVEHTRLSAAYEEFTARESSYGEGVCLVAAGRTPMQTILVDWAGLEQFAMHLYDMADAVLTLYEAQLRLFERAVEMIARGPGRVVSVLENFTAETMGPRRFERFHVPVYRRLFPMLTRAGKQVSTHFDGKLAGCADLIAASPIGIVESFTPPPEGDMTLAEARSAWPDKLLWSNINVSAWTLPPDQLRAEVRRRAAEGAPDGRGLAFEISEDLPDNWRRAVPVVLEALAE